ncbi:MAG: hypothetical protein KGJ07_03710 [Patescibacteria group bacterium]|nr:hypothetical protein [Patescibacteria group bacterium]
MGKKESEELLENEDFSFKRRHGHHGSGFFRRIGAGIKKDVNITKNVVNQLHKDISLNNIHKALKKISLRGVLHDTDFIALAPVRLVLLIILKKNMLGLATDFQKEQEKVSPAWMKIEGDWTALGGADRKFAEAVAEGSTKKPFLSHFENLTEAQKTGITGGAASLAGIITATSSGTAAAVAVPAAGVITGMVQVLPTDSPSKQAVDSLPQATDAEAQADAAGAKGSAGQKFKDAVFSKKGLIIGIVAVLGVGGFFLFKHK